jgi:hypothetical protein
LAEKSNDIQLKFDDLRSQSIIRDFCFWVILSIKVSCPFKWFHNSAVCIWRWESNSCLTGDEPLSSYFVLLSFAANTSPASPLFIGATPCLFFYWLNARKGHKKLLWFKYLATFIFRG